MNYVVIASTGGSVLEELLADDFFRQRLSCVVCDRSCGAISVAKKFGVPFKVYETKSGLAFSNFLLAEFLNCPPSLFVSFYTRLFSGDFLSFAHQKLINMHLSILPAFPGLKSFDDALTYGAKFIGASIHLVDKGVDTGFPIIQSAIPRDPNKSNAEIRHLIFQHQCKMLRQLIKWVDDGRLSFEVDGKPIIIGGKYDPSVFSPNLERLPLW